MTKTTTNTTKSAKKEPVNVHVKFDSKREKVVIEIPASRFKMSTMVEANLDEYETTANGNFIVGTTSGYDSIKAEGFEHIGFTVSAVAKKKLVMEERTRIETMAKQREMATEALAESKAKAAGDVVTMTKAEYDEIMALKELMQKVLGK